MAQSKTPFTADPADEIPVGVQLGWRLRALIGTGRLSPGERMPSVRALAGWAGVNVNTVRGVYARLEEEGLISTRHGAGSFVADDAGGSPEVERIAGEALESARAAGVDPREVAIAALVAAALPESLEPVLADQSPGEPVLELTIEELAAELEIDDSWLEADEVGARHELRRQIARLEAQLASYRRDIEPLDEDRPRRLHPPEPRIASAEDLERTRDALLRRLADARTVAARRARAEQHARAARDEIAADPAAHRWQAVSAADTGEEGCVTWESAPRFGPLGALMNWWRVKVSGGCP